METPVPKLTSSNDLDILIEALQRQAAYLENEIADCVRESDFAFALKYQQALIATRFRLRTLLLLQDPDYDRRQSLQDLLERAEDRLRRNPGTARQQASLEARTQELRQRLDALPVKPGRPRLDGQEILEALHLLLGGSVPRLSLSHAGGDHIDLHRTPDALGITLGWSSAPCFNYSEVTGGTRALAKLGFKLRPGGALLTLSPPYPTPVKLLELLAAVVEDGFGWSDGELQLREQG